MQLKTPFAILQAEVVSQTRPGNVLEPWSWEGAPKFFGFDGNDDPRYPINGVSNIPRDNMDMADVITCESDWTAFRKFMDEFRRRTHEGLDLYRITTDSGINSHRHGAAIFSKYMNKIMDRKKSNRRVDMLCRELGIAPYQIAATMSIGKNWPPVKLAVSCGNPLFFSFPLNDCAERSRSRMQSESKR